jgi:hypothetical protein
MADSPGRHPNIHNLVGFLVKGRHLTPEAQTHLMGCAKCRDLLIVVAQEEFERQLPAGRCQTRKRLFREWRDAAEMYAKTLAELAGNIGKIRESEPLKLRRIAEGARKLTAQFSTELDEHIAKHRCR